MKNTLDDKKVPSRCYYYLLEFNQQNNFKLIKEVEPDSNGRLSLLTYDQFWELLRLATEMETNEIKAETEKWFRDNK